nr:cation-transporting P-type ATPase [Hydrogenophilus thiooxidans]
MSPEVQALLARLATDPTVGLSWEEVRRRQRIHGRNLSAGLPVTPRADRTALLRCALAVACVVLAVATAIEQEATSVAWSWLLVGGTLLAAGWGAVRWGQQAARRLTRVPWDLWVLREGAWHRVPAPDLVPGDILWLTPGTLYPAQLHLLTTSPDWQTEPWQRSTQVVSGQAWAVVVRPSRIDPRGVVALEDEADKSAGWVWPALAVAGWSAVLVVGEAPLAIWLHQLAVLALVLFPWFDSEVRSGWAIASRLRFATRGVWFRTPHAVTALGRAVHITVARTAWFEQWRVAALLLPFDTVRCDKAAPSPEHDAPVGPHTPELQFWRGARRVLNPLAVTGMVPFAQAVRVTLAPGPGCVTLLPTGNDAVAASLLQSTCALVGDSARDPLTQWRVVARERKPEWGPFGWLTRCADRRGRVWVVATGEPEALRAAGVTRAAWRGAFDSDQWFARIEAARREGAWVIGVAHGVGAPERADANTEPLAWLGACAVVPDPAGSLAAVASTKPSEPEGSWRVFADDVPATTLAAWRERGWWPGSAESKTWDPRVQRLPPGAPWALCPATTPRVPRNADPDETAPSILVLLDADRFGFGPLPDVRIAGGLARFAAVRAQVRSELRRMARWQRRLQWRWGIAAETLALWLTVDPTTPVAALPALGLVWLQIQPFLSIRNRGKITISENTVTEGDVRGGDDDAIRDDRRP